MKEVIDNLSLDEIEKFYDNELIIKDQFKYNPKKMKEIILELIARAYELGYMVNVDNKDVINDRIIDGLSLYYEAIDIAKHKIQIARRRSVRGESYVTLSQIKKLVDPKGSIK